MSWCARALELSRAATPAPTREPPRPRPLLKAVITLCPEQGPALPAPESWRRQALRARFPRHSSGRAETWRLARASLGREGDLLRPSAARTCAHTHTTFYKRRSNTNAQALRSTQKHRRRRARGTVYWLVQGFVSKPRKSSSAFSSKWPSQEPHTTFLCQFGWVERLSLEKFSCAKIRRLSP